MVASAGTAQDEPATPNGHVQTEQQVKVPCSPNHLEKPENGLGNHVLVEKLDKPLGEHQYLEKQDQLRDIGIGIDTSRIVVVGSQSSGKSALLENLTGLSFPRGQDLCTRFATQFTLRRSDSIGTAITIIPSSSSSSDRKSYLKRFRYTVDGDWQISDLPDIINEASKYMGIKPVSEANDPKASVFTKHILKLEVSGPEKPHLTVIDVPGLFHVTGHGSYATEARKSMVDRMVRQQIENERTIILAVMSCLSDPATERILEYAKVADPSGARTIGVLTKPDLVKEQAMFQSILKHVKQSPLKLGYYVVRSRGGDEDDLELNSVKDKEQELFAKPEWNGISKLGRSGIEPLKSSLQSILTTLAKQELPKQKLEVAKLWEDRRKQREAMGAPRSGPTSQREYLVKLASRFQLMTHNALEGQYVHPDFAQHTNLRLVSLVINMNEVFAELMRRSGHKYRFHGFELCWLGGSDLMNKVLRTTPESLSNIIPVKFFQNEMPRDGLENIIEEHYSGFKGPELGTFGGSVLTILFREQAQKWREYAEMHIKTVVVVIDHFLRSLLSQCCSDKEVAHQLWENAMHDRLLDAYKRALAHAEFLVDSELLGRPYTYNHYFNENLQRARNRRIAAAQAQAAHVHGQPSVITTESANVDPHSPPSVNVNTSVPFQQPNKTHADQVKENIFDVLKSYYKIARKRFVDAICQQVVSRLLLDGEESPLKILCPELIAKLTDNQLDQIAGEDSASKSKRQRLDEEIEGFEAAMGIFRT